LPLVLVHSTRSFNGSLSLLLLVVVIVHSYTPLAPCFTTMRSRALIENSLLLVIYTRERERGSTFVHPVKAPGHNQIAAEDPSLGKKEIVAKTVMLRGQWFFPGRAETGLCIYLVCRIIMMIDPDNYRLGYDAF
jgi:hypothetical protein